MFQNLKIPVYVIEEQKWITTKKYHQNGISGFQVMAR